MARSCQVARIRLDYKVVATAVRKDEHHARYCMEALDPSQRNKVGTRYAVPNLCPQVTAPRSQINLWLHIGLRGHLLAGVRIEIAPPARDMLECPRKALRCTEP